MTSQDVLLRYEMPNKIASSSVNAEVCVEELGIDPTDQDERNSRNEPKEGLGPTKNLQHRMTWAQ